MSTKIIVSRAPALLEQEVLSHFGAKCGDEGGIACVLCPDDQVEQVLQTLASLSIETLNTGDTSPQRNPNQL